MVPAGFAPGQMKKACMVAGDDHANDRSAILDNEVEKGCDMKSLLPVLASALRWGKEPFFFASFSGVLAIVLFFRPPALGFIPGDPRDIFIPAVLLFLTVVTGAIASRLQKEARRLRALSSRLQSIREEERTMVAREIHDQLGQALTGLKLGLALLSRRLPEDRKELGADLKAMVASVDDTIRLVRKIATELRPGVLDDLGLVAAIEWQIEDFKQRTGIEVVLCATLKDEELHRDLSTALFRILQEALTNIIRHAQATRVHIDLFRQDDAIVMRVADNGKGIAERATHNPRSLGLLGMRERAGMLGGEARIGSSREGGAKVVIKIPFKKKIEENA